VAELVAPGRLVVSERVTATPEADQVRIAVQACGVCGSDVHRYRGKARQQYPIILGHEITGVVDAVGPEVARLRPGDAVVVAPLIPCDECRACRAGDYGLCQHYSFIGSRRPGGFASTVAVPERNSLRLPHGVDGFAPALVEPLAVGCYALARAGAAAGDTVVVVGGGTIGLCAALMAEAAGAEVTVLDVVPDRVAHAARLGLRAHLVDAADTEPRLGSVVIEAAGSAAALHTALRVTRPNGRIACVGTPRGELTLSVDAWELVLRKQLHLIGVWNCYGAPFPGGAWAAAIQSLTADAERVSQLITHRFPLQHAQQCLEWMVANPGCYGKVILIP